MNEDKIREMEKKYIKGEFTNLEVIAEFEDELIGYCYEASKIVEDEKFKSLLLNIEDKKIKNWLDKVIEKKKKEKIYLT